MNLKRMMVLCALALGSLAVGCGNKCKSACDDEKKCPSATGTPAALDCDTLCDDIDKVSDAASCGSQKDKLYDCEDGIKDKCATDASNQCSSQNDAWTTCVLTYCTAHPDDADCKKFGTDFGGT